MQGNQIIISLANIVAIQANQADERSRSFGDPISDFAESFALEGWDNLQGIVAAYKLTEREQEAAIKQRKQDVKSWRERGEEVFNLFERDGQKVTATYSELADFAAALWTDEKGDYVSPEYGANCCYRRLYAAPASLLAYKRYDGTREDFTIPAIVKDYPTGKSRAEAMMIDRLTENAQTGRAKYDPVELLIISIKLVKRGDSETTIRQRLNVTRGTSQKLHALATICNRYDGLNLVDRFSMPAPTDDEGKPVKAEYTPAGYLPYGKVKAGFARTLLGKAKSTEKMDAVARAAMGDKYNVAATEEQVETAFRLLMAGGTNAKKIMDKDTIARFKDSTSSELARRVFDAILTNDGDAMATVLDELKEVEKVSA